MTRRSYRVISCEGGDQCGKADAILGFLRRFQERGVSITFSSFPIYASPIGTVIRKFLKNDLKEFNFDPKKELKIKMALYALDRLQFLDVILNDPKYLSTLVVLDRSSFSNAVTLAYGKAYIEDLTEEELVKLIKYAFWLDGLMIRKLKLKKCVVEMASQTTDWENVRNEKRDIYENTEVQKATKDLYGKYQEKVGEGWKKIVTRTEKGWEDRGDIFNDIYDFVVSRHGEFNLEVFPKKYTVNIQEIIENSYPSALVKQGDIDKYWKALNDNDKDTMYEYGIKVGEQVGNTTKEFLLHNEDVRTHFCKIIRKEPDVLKVFGEMLGENYKERVIESIDIWESEN